MGFIEQKTGTQALSVAQSFGGALGTDGVSQGCPGPFDLSPVPCVPPLAGPVFLLAGDVSGRVSISAVDMQGDGFGPDGVVSDFGRGIRRERAMMLIDLRRRKRFVAKAVLHHRIDSALGRDQIRLFSTMIDWVRQGLHWTAVQED